LIHSVGYSLGLASLLLGCISRRFGSDRCRRRCRNSLGSRLGLATTLLRHDLRRDLDRRLEGIALLLVALLILISLGLVDSLLVLSKLLPHLSQDTSRLGKSERRLLGAQLRALLLAKDDKCRASSLGTRLLDLLGLADRDRKDFGVGLAILLDNCLLALVALLILLPLGLVYVLDLRRERLPATTLLASNINKAHAGVLGNDLRANLLAEEEVIGRRALSVKHDRERRGILGLGLCLAAALLGFGRSSLGNSRRRCHDDRRGSRHGLGDEGGRLGLLGLLGHAVYVSRLCENSDAAS
jgi:hypothetical protein